jgi:hypothetical protein
VLLLPHDCANGSTVPEGEECDGPASALARDRQGYPADATFFLAVATLGAAAVRVRVSRAAVPRAANYEQPMRLTAHTLAPGAPTPRAPPQKPKELSFP